MPDRTGRRSYIGCMDIPGVKAKRRAASIRQLSFLLEFQMLLSVFSWLVAGYFLLAVQYPPTSQLPGSPVLLV